MCESVNSCETCKNDLPGSYERNAHDAVIATADGVRVKNWSFFGFPGFRYFCSVVCADAFYEQLKAEV